MLRRHYVHGDQKEDSEGIYYCTRCDSFEEEAHFFDDTHIANRVEQYQASFNRWKSWDKDSKSRLRRPENANNLLRLLVDQDVKKFNSSKSRFYKWIEKQTKRDDIIGDLAIDILRDLDFPVTSMELAVIRSHISYKSNINSEVFVAFYEAWEEFSSKIKLRTSISSKTRFAIFKRDLYCCRICGNSASNEIRLEVDHKIPVAKGGTNSEENLWTLCFDCNRGKAAQDL